jgi:hypothetical protein
MCLAKAGGGQQLPAQHCPHEHYRGGSRTVPYNGWGGRAGMFAGATHAAARTACRGDAVRRPGAIVHDGPTERDAAVQRAHTLKATRRVASTLRAGKM